MTRLYKRSGRASEPDDPLPIFLRAAASTPWRWSESDCVMWLANWIKARRGVDPGAAFRGAYHDALSCAELLRQRGGPRRHISDCGAPFGIIETAEPERGDIGLSSAPVKRGGRMVTRPTGVICLDPERARWAMLTIDLGVVISDGIKTSAAWRA